MKITANLGVLREKDLKHPTTCFRLSKSLTQISDALAFGEFYTVPAKTALNEKDLKHVSAGIYTSANAATQLAHLIDDKAIKKDIEAYSRSAHRFNETVLRPIIKGKRSKPITPQDLKKTTIRLRVDLANIEKKVENLCTVEKKAPPIITKKVSVGSRVGSSFSRATMGINTKKPIYPRYYVASMGRSKL